MTLGLWTRIGALACLGAALAMGLLALREAPRPAMAPAAASVALPADPLRATLRRCQLAGQAAGSDPGCLAAWAENRRRFLGLGRAEPAGPAPGSGAATAANGAAIFAQEQ